MTTTVFMGGRRLCLADRDLLGVGGEGRVYRVRDRAIKVFFAMSDERRRKLAAFPTGLGSRVVGPLELCTDASGEIVGYAMRALAGAVDIQRAGQRKWREATLRADGVLATFRDLARSVAELHARNVVVGDLNDANVLLTPPATAGQTRKTDDLWAPWLIDADSMQYAGFPCVVAHERFLDPRLFGIDLSRTSALSRESDWYALAVLLFASLVFVHPFGGAHPSYPTLLRRAEARHSVLRRDVKLPHAAQKLDVLDDDSLAWFADVFDRDARAPLPASLLASRFTRCSCGAEHARRSCPQCTASVTVPAAVRARGHVRATTVFRGTGGERIVAAAVQGGLRYAVLDPRSLALRREDGRRVPGALAHAGRARIAGPSTWLLGTSGGRAMRVEQEHVTTDLPLASVHGEPAGDAGPFGLIHVDGEWLVRAADGTRIGQVLEGQTHVRTGLTLGLAFYRAGAITMHFVFDTRRGPLRQIDLPSLEGRLVDWSASFDDGHVLFCTATEKAGRVTYAAHLVSGTGELLASVTGPEGSSAMLGTAAFVGGKCVAQGAVLTATDDGLVLLRADLRTRTFVPVRAFPETRDIVPPDADVLVGPGGSVYVVTHDEIVHLCFEGNPSK